MERTYLRSTHGLNTAWDWTRRMVGAALSVVVLLTMLVALAGSLPAVAHADTVDATAVILLNGTQRYSQPDSSSSVVDVVDAGRIVTVSSTSTDGWLTGTTGDNVRYYVRTDAVRIMTEPALTDGATRTLYKGVATTTVSIYAAPSQSSPVLLTYGEGTILQFNRYCDGWYMAIATLPDGSQQLAFVSDASLGMLDMTQDTTSRVIYSGVTLSSPTNIYESPSAAGTVLETLASGTTISYSRFSDGWYMASYGSGALCYISASDVSTFVGDGTRKPGYVTSAITGYSLPNLASVPTSIPGGSVITYSTWNADWMCVTVGGSTLYVPLGQAGSVSDTIPQATTQVTSYGVTLIEATSIQMAVTPLTDVTGRWLHAGGSQVSAYLDPSSFSSGSGSYMQFATLGGYTGVTAGQLDAVLQGCGALEGQGATFVAASQEYGVNEVYLVAHALLETGRGTSSLANGSIQSRGLTYYNFYGYGASDTDGYSGGAGYAIRCGWDSPESAIYGFAAKVSTYYIDSGQDTLYKMRWNPSVMSEYGYASHQYASDVGWASKIGSLMASIYQSAGVSYAGTYDVPAYR